MSKQELEEIEALEALGIDPEEIVDTQNYQIMMVESDYDMHKRNLIINGGYNYSGRPLFGWDNITEEGKKLFK